MSNIEWTNKTWNPVSGCTRASAGCENCYAVTMTHRLEAMGQAKYAGLTVLNGKGDRHFNGVVRTHEDELTKPQRWKKPAKVFVNSMSDLFHKDVPFEFIDRVFAVMALCPQHTFQVLTKRPERMAEYTADHGRLTMVSQAGALMGHGNATMRFRLPLPNVWLGTSVENQQAADERIPHLLRCPAAVRFLSCEPLLGETDLMPWLTVLYHNDRPRGNRIDWVIAGGESGPGARPCNVEWIRSIVRQCKAAGVPVFVKQLGKWVAGEHEFDGWKGAIDRWLLRDTDGTEFVWRRPILRSQFHPQYFDERPVNAVAWGLCDTKGGNPSEWPADLRVREFPEATR